MRNFTLNVMLILGCSVLFAQQPETLINDWDGNAHDTYEFNQYGNGNCWCVWAGQDTDNPNPAGINTSAKVLSYPAHTWVETNWWSAVSGMIGFKQLPTTYLQDHKYVYLEYLIGDNVSNEGVDDTTRSPVGETIQMKLQVNGASSDDGITTEVLHEFTITADDLNTWKAITLEIPEAAQNSDYTILNIWTGVDKYENVEIEFYYDNIGLTNQKITGVAVNDWDGLQYSNYEFNQYGNGNCWCVWAGQDTDNPNPAGINTSAKVLSYPAHTWVETNWWSAVSGMIGFKQLPTTYLQDHKYVYLEYLIGDNVSNEGVDDTTRSPVGETIQMKLQVNGASSDDGITTEVLHEFTITADDLNTWKAITLEIPEAAQNSDYTILNIWTGVDKYENVEIEFYYDNIFLTNNQLEAETLSINSFESKKDFLVYMSDDQLNIKMNESGLLKDVEIYDMTGLLILKEQFNSSENELSVPFNFSHGVYIVKLSSDNQSYVKKFVKK